MQGEKRVRVSDVINQGDPTVTVSSRNQESRLLIRARRGGHPSSFAVSPRPIP